MTALAKIVPMSMANIDDTTKMAEALLETGHYKKLGMGGIFAIIQMARAVGADPMQCLNGGMYPIDGKVEMESKLMMALIRQKGHSITKDKKSDNNICILHGKRVDNGDGWSESFSVEDAKKAGLLSRGGVWSKYTRDMLFNRALSRLARCLFSDVIKGCYVLGEISEAPSLNSKVNESEQNQFETEIISEVESVPVINTITAEQAKQLDKLIGDNDEYRETLGAFLKKYYGIDSLSQMPADILEKVMVRVNTINEQKQEKA